MSDLLRFDATMPAAGRAARPAASRAPRAERDLRPALLEAIGEPRRDVLDVACGGGSEMLFLSAEGHRVSGADTSAERVRGARALADERGLWLDVRIAGPDRLPWPDGAFDAVRAAGVLPRLADPYAAVREWLRVLRPDGRIVVSQCASGPDWSALGGRLARALRAALSGPAPPAEAATPECPFARGLDAATAAEFLTRAGLRDVRRGDAAPRRGWLVWAARRAPPV